VHSVGDYITAGSLFALGLAAWQVLVALLVGITIVYFLCNLVARPSQATGVPYPVISRVSFGVMGANIPAIIRGLIAVAWYGIQTYLASHSLVIVALKLWPGLAPYADVDNYGFTGLSLLGWVAFVLMWITQAFVFWKGMEAIRKFIDFCGPAVYVVMFLLAGYLVYAAGWENIDLNLAEVSITGWAVVPVMLTAIALVVSYFSGPMLNYGDFTRYGRSFADVKKGNFLGLPVNFLVFALLVVVTAAATQPVFGELITDPVETVARLDSTFAVVLGALTFMIATVGINIVANFVSPAFDFSNVNPQKISWRMGGMIADVGSVLLTPWNLYSRPRGHPLHAGHPRRVHRPAVRRADLRLLPDQEAAGGRRRPLHPAAGRHLPLHQGLHPYAIIATAVGAVLAMIVVFFASSDAAAFSWFIGAFLSFGVHYALSRRSAATTAA
jgi:nucleobase:cation symporter-1, NCS1 family